MTKEEIYQSIDEIVGNDELTVKIFEVLDNAGLGVVEENFEPNEFESKYNELLARYKERFMSGGEVSEDETEVEEKEPEEKTEETEVEEIDIFEDDEEKKGDK